MLVSIPNTAKIIFQTCWFFLKSLSEYSASIRNIKNSIYLLKIGMAFLLLLEDFHYLYYTLFLMHKQKIIFLFCRGPLSSSKIMTGLLTEFSYSL